MTATKQQPIAGYRISDPSDPTIKPWLSDTPDDNGYTSEPLYAGAAPAAVAPQGERQWICPTRTVADLVNNLLTMDQALPIYGAQYIEKDGRRCAIAVPPTVSRERVKDGRWIGQGEELNAAVVWTRAEQPVAAPGLTDGQLNDESYRVNDEPGFADAFRAGARFAERVHGVTASAARAVTGKADWWRGRADEIEVRVARSGSQEAMRCYTDMRTLLQAAAPALEAPAALLTKPALVGGGRFGVGVPERYVIEAAQRHHEQEGQREAMTAEQFADEERKRRTLWELIHGPLEAAPQAPAAPVVVEGVAQFRKRPVTISAIQWTGKNLREVITFTDGPPETRGTHAGMAWEAYTDLVERDGLMIYTLEGKMHASVGDWIIRGVKGEHYACKPDIFAETYEPAMAAPAAPAVDAQAERDAAFESVRQRLCRIPRWSFHIDSRGNIRRVDDARGNWIEFSAAHELFDPVAVDSALAAQAAAKGEHGNG